MPKIPYLIAEVKTQSPYGFTSSQSWDELFDIAHEHGDMISIHTDPRWGGSFELIKRAAKRTTKPILAKGIHEDDKDVIQALEYGASSVLVVGRLPSEDLLDKCLIEPRHLVQLGTLIEQVPSDQRFVWNSRDLNSGRARDLAEYNFARKVWGGWLCQASNIAAPEDIQHDANAILVGEYLVDLIRLL